jgi:hypothetical protein
MAPRKKKTRYEEEPLVSDYKDLFENCRKALFQDWVPGEDANAKKVREDIFRAFYNDSVKVTGRVQRETFIMKHDAGFMPPPTMTLVSKSMGIPMKHGNLILRLGNLLLEGVLMLRFKITSYIVRLGMDFSLQKTL